MDGKQLKQLVGLRFADVETMFYQGRITESVWEAYCRVWDWSAPRYSGTAGFNQERFWNTHGKEAYLRRMGKTRNAFGLNGKVAP